MNSTRHSLPIRAPGAAVLLIAAAVGMTIPVAIGDDTGLADDRSESLRVTSDPDTLAGTAPCGPADGCSSTSECLYDGIENVALGGAELSISSPLTHRGTLTVSNIGSSGKDGVSQDPLPPGTTDMSTGIACPNFAQSVQGTKAEIQMYADNVPGQLASTLTIENVDGIKLLANADFSPVGVTDYTVQIYLGEQPVVTLPNQPNGIVCLPRVDFNIVRCFWHGPYYIICYKLTWVTDIIVPPFPQPFRGDIVYVITRPQFPCGNQLRINNFFTDTGPVEMTFQYAGPTVEPIRCGPGAAFEPCGVPHNSPGCSDPNICECVCQTLPDCCMIQWDQQCVDAIEPLGCGLALGDCCQPHNTPGCNDPAVAQCVCNFEPFCCQIAWDPFCVQLVDALGCGICFGPNCIPGAPCVFDGIPNQPLGNAQLSLNPNGNLVVSNIGSSGKDGVRQVLPEGSQEMVTGLECPNFQFAPEGATADIQMYADVPGGLLSNLFIQCTNNQLQATADFSPVGATLYTVQIMIGDVMVASIPNLANPTTIFPKVDFNEIDCLIHPQCHISYKLTCVVPIFLPGLTAQPPIDGDVIWVIAQNPTVSATIQTRVDNLFSFPFPIEGPTGAAIEMTYQYAGETAQEPPACGPAPHRGCCFEAGAIPGCDDADCCGTVCEDDPFCCVSLWDQICADAAMAVCDTLTCSGDTNNDGQVNVDDLNNVILDWGTDGSANGGDVTGPIPGSAPDGTVDVNDLNAVIVGWGPCP